MEAVWGVQIVVASCSVVGKVAISGNGMGVVGGLGCAVVEGVGLFGAVFAGFDVFLIFFTQ